MDINQFYSEAFEAVCHYKKPFNFFNKYYVVATTDRSLYKGNHLLWVDYLLDKFNQYHSAGFTVEESEVNSLLDGLEAVVKGDLK